MAAGKNGSVKCGLSHVDNKAMMDDRFKRPLRALDMIINMRATVSPRDLVDIVQRTVAKINKIEKGEAELAYLNTFRPSAPNPNHRFNKDARWHA